MNNVLKILSLLCDYPETTVEELAEKTGLCVRSVRHNLGLLDSYKFVIERKRGRVRLLVWSPEYRDFRVPLFLGSEERRLLQSVTEGQHVLHPLWPEVQARIMAKTEDTPPPVLYYDERAEARVRTVNYAIRTKRQVVLQGYRSGKGTRKDHRVEPVKWSPNYRQLFAYDKEKERVLTFVMARAEEVLLLEARWEHEEEHAVPDMDVFWMTGKEVEEVTLAMDQMALNLLHEEFPISPMYAVEETGGEGLPYLVTLPTRQPQGVGRFVIGMTCHCEVKSGERVLAFMEEEERKKGMRKLMAM